MIKFDKNGRIFTLSNKNLSYVFYVNEYDMLVKLYFGKRLSEIGKNHLDAFNELGGDVYRFYDVKKDKEQCLDEHLSNQYMSLEVPPFLSFDKREALISITHEDNSSVTDFRYFNHEIMQEKPSFSDLPFIRDEQKSSETLVITLKDIKDEIYLKMYYTIFSDVDVVVRHNEIINRSKKEIKINQAYSACLDLNSNNYELISLYGAYASDRLLERQDITHNRIVIEDNAGGKGFSHNPVAALKDKNSGECFGFGLVYSSNFQFSFTGSEMNQTRVLLGLSNYNFEYPLKENESFITPEAVLIYSANEDEMIHNFHDLIRNHLLRNQKKKDPHTILLNSWEGSYMDFDTEKILSFIDKAEKMGVNLFVLDDGWFRNDDTYGLGDWKVDTKKIDLHKVINYAHKKNMRFGLWIEPEQISFNSSLYKKHPEYALMDPSLEKVTSLRHQLVIDMTNKEVRDNIFEQINAIFDEYHLDYCKWDFNRSLCEPYSSSLEKRYQRVIFHKFILGTYDLLNRFVTRYPDVVLETCAGGGGRFDMGMLFYSDQIWGSDETDAISRSEIQYSSNYFYPLRVLGSHVSARKYLNIFEKAHIAMFGTFGYELDPNSLKEKDYELIKKANKLYLDNEYLVDNGDYYPLIDPSKNNFVSWMITSKDQTKAVVLFMNYRHINWRARFVKLKGLDPNKKYINSLDNKVYQGDFYMNVGLNLSMGMTNFSPMIIELKAIK